MNVPKLPTSDPFLDGSTHTVIAEVKLRPKLTLGGEAGCGNSARPTSDAGINSQSSPRLQGMSREACNNGGALLCAQPPRETRSGVAHRGAEGISNGADSTDRRICKGANAGEATCMRFSKLPEWHHGRGGGQHRCGQGANSSVQLLL